jgi:Zn finger protein HypA/HybF involved in hydrogenase expression
MKRDDKCDDCDALLGPLECYCSNCGHLLSILTGGYVCGYCQATFSTNGKMTRGPVLDKVQLRPNKKQQVEE